MEEILGKPQQGRVLGRSTVRLRLPHGQQPYRYVQGLCLCLLFYIKCVAVYRGLLPPPVCDKVLLRIS